MIDVPETTVRELGRRSLSGTVAHVVPLAFVEVTIGASGLGLGVLLIAVTLLGVRLLARAIAPVSARTTRYRFTLLAVGGVGINVLWGVINAFFQVNDASDKASLVMAILICGISVGGVTAFAANRRLQAAALIGLLAPSFVCGLFGELSVEVTILYMVFFFYMSGLGRNASRDYWSSVETGELLKRHAVEQEQAAAEAIAVNRQLRAEIENRARMEIELRQAQKLEAVGRLAAGIAHEINTPLQYITDSCHFLRDGIVELEAGTSDYACLLSELVKRQTSPEDAETRAARIRDERDLDFLRDQLSPATARVLDGLERISKIVVATKEFAASDTQGKSATDINRTIEHTLVMCRHETAAVADVVTDLSELPLALVHRGELSQALLNIIVNAAYAVGSVSRETGRKGEIRIKTCMPVANKVRVEISDSGGGIPAEILDRIFDPFFTTKPVGDGAGQGLAVAHAIVVGKHGGTLDVSTVPKIGSTFAITLPL